MLSKFALGKESMADRSSSISMNQKGLQELKDFLKREFLARSPVTTVIDGVKQLQSAYNLTDIEVIATFWDVRLKVVFHWNETPERIIAQWIFNLDKYLSLVANFSTSQAVFDKTLTTLWSFPHLLNPNAGMAVHTFMSKLTLACNQHFPASAAYKKFVGELFDKYADFFIEDLIKRGFSKGLLEGFLELGTPHQLDNLYDGYLTGFFNGMLGIKPETPEEAGINIILL